MLTMPELNVNINKSTAHLLESFRIKIINVGSSCKMPMPFFKHFYYEAIDIWHINDEHPLS